MPKRRKSSPRNFQLEGAGFRSTMKKSFKQSQKAWDKFLKPLVNFLAQIIGLSIGAQSKNPQVSQATKHF